MGKINTMNSNNSTITTSSSNINSGGNSIITTRRSSKAFVKTLDSNNNNNTTIIRNNNNNKILVVEINQNKSNTNVNEDEGGNLSLSSSPSVVHVTKLNTDGGVVTISSSSLPSSPSSSTSASSSSLASSQASATIKDTFFHQQEEIDKREKDQNNSGNLISMNIQENDIVKTEVKTSSTQDEKLSNDFLIQPQSEITLQNSPIKSINLILPSGEIGKKCVPVNSQSLSPYLSANILLNGPNLNSVKSNNSFNLTNALANLNNSNENIYFMMQTSNELMCTHPSSPIPSSSFVQPFKSSPLNSPTQTNKLFLSQNQLQSILCTQNNNVFPPPPTIVHHSPLDSNTISLANNLSSPNINLKNSISSSSSSSNTSINNGVKGVRDERRRANHNEVERRRRDNINKWIVELSKVIPDCSNDQSKHGQQSKGGILEKTVQYLLDIKEENLRLIDHIKTLEKCKFDNEALRQQNDYLLKENEILRSGKCDELDMK